MSSNYSHITDEDELCAAVAANFFYDDIARAQIEGGFRLGGKEGAEAMVFGLLGRRVIANLSESELRRWEPNWDQARWVSKIVMHFESLARLTPEAQDSGPEGLDD